VPAAIFVSTFYHPETPLWQAITAGRVFFRYLADRARLVRTLFASRGGERTGQLERIDCAGVRNGTDRGRTDDLLRANSSQTPYVVGSKGFWFGLNTANSGCLAVFCSQFAVLDVREDDFSGLDLASQGTGTRSVSSSNQLRRMLTWRGETFASPNSSARRPPAARG